MTSITTALGAGAGIDTRALVDSLANAAAAPAKAALDKRDTANRALLSALGEAGAGIDTLARAMTERVQSGGLTPSLTASDPAALTFTGATGALPPSLRVGVLSRASPQTSVVGPVPADTRFGGGTLRIGVSEVALGDGGTLSQIAGAINAAGVRVNARVLSEVTGSRLTIVGESGAASAFTLDYVGSDASLAALVTQARVAQPARDARVRIDGVELASATDNFAKAVAGGTLTLTGAAEGATVRLTATRPNEASTSLLEDFTGAYNELLGKLNALAANRPGEAAGPARGNSAVRAIIAGMRALTTTAMRSDGGSPATLAELGLRTQRDGTLALDKLRLGQALEQDPRAVARLLLPMQTSSDPRVMVTSDPARVAPGRYALTELSLSADGVASGRLDGVAMQSVGRRLVAPAASAAAGLAIELEAGLPSTATLDIGGGLSGALRSLRDTVSSSRGPLSRAKEAAEAEARRITDERAVADRRAATYRAQLETRFGSMDRLVGGFRATQAYLTQQIAAWNASER